jgi:hypothetical protein
MLTELLFTSAELEDSGNTSMQIGILDMWTERVLAAITTVDAGV